MFRHSIVGAVLLALTGSQQFAMGQVTIGRNFGGTTAAIQPIPPDTMGAVGVDHYVELNNHRFKVYRKSDGVEIESKGINQFWMDANASPQMTAFDPRIAYDPHAQRWYAVSVDNKQNANNVLFAVSSSSDPTQPWHGFAIDSDADDSNWADFPMLGYNNEAVWISAFMPTLGAAPSQSSLIGLPKLDLLQPVPTVANKTQFDDVVPSATAGTHPQLAVDTSLAGGNMVALGMSSFGGGALLRAEVGLSSAAPTQTGTIFVSAAQPPTVVQPGAPAIQNLEANDWRLSSNTVLKGNLLYGVQTVEHMGRAAVQLHAVDLLTNSVGSEIIADPALAFTFPSVAVNDFGDVVIGVTETSATEFASSYALVRRAGSGLFEPPLLLAPGVDNYVRLDSLNRNRWGDYSATTIDPADPSIIWTNQEYVDGTNRWATQVSELILPRANEARWAEPADGVFDDPTMWVNGGVPLPSDELVFSRPTDGSITIVLPPPASGAYVFPTASFRQGNVRLDLGGHQLDLMLHLEVGPYYAAPQTTLANGVVTSVIGAIAPRATSEGSLTLDNAQWSANDVSVGSASTGTLGYPGEFGGTGALTIDNNSQLIVANTLRIFQRGTVNLDDGVLTAAMIDNSFGPRGFSFAGGTLHVDKYLGELVNDGGILAPGPSIGMTDVALAYFQRAAGTLAIDIGGPLPADHDQLRAAVVELAGTLDINLTAGFVPVLGQSLDIIAAAGGVIGAFTAVNQPAGMPPGLLFDVVYSPTMVQLVAVMAPIYSADFDRDGDVDRDDLTQWQGDFGINAVSDADGDGDSDGHDFLTWQRQAGSVPTVPVAEIVPEPAAISLAGVAALLLGLARPRAVGAPAIPGPKKSPKSQFSP
jgi:hypothetical protein